MESKNSFAVIAALGPTLAALALVGARRRDPESHSTIRPVFETAVKEVGI